MKRRVFYRLGCCFALLTALAAGPVTAVAAQAASAAVPIKRHKHRKHRPAQTASATVVSSSTGKVVARTETRAALIHTGSSSYLRRSRRRIYFNPWTEPTYADSTVGDNVDGEDLMVRKAAIDAIGPYNGAIVVADPQTGRILSIVNQKLALKGAYQPCSTVKVMVSLASLSEGIVAPDAFVRLTRRFSLDMTDALARSNNMYFAKLGEELGFDRVEKYAKVFGLGEKAGLDIPGEEAGFLTVDPPTSGVGMMTSFGDGIRLTPLELTSIISTVANGGTMYYLQYPRSQADAQNFVPRIKRVLDVQAFIPQIKPGLLGAVEYGTARRANYDATEPVYGKTGTCTDTAQPGVHLGWFGSFNDTGTHKLAVIVLLTGGRGISGPVASGIAGNLYHNLSQQHYFGPAQASYPTALISLPTPGCCSR